VLSKRVGAVAAAMADQITAEVSFYREQRTVSPAELRKAALALTCHAAVPQRGAVALNDS
jgi:hypothetical protein